VPAAGTERISLNTIGSETWPDQAASTSQAADVRACRF
jgi:hypothetical protein